MFKQKTSVYFVPGMAAGKEIFRNIRLPEDQFEMHILEWLIPEKNESMESYAGRMANLITDKDVVLVGVSFGGVVAQEMATFVKPKRLIIISSVKSQEELPARLRLAGKTGAYKLMPTRMMLSAEDLTKFSIGPRSKKRLKLYQAFLHVRDQRYLDWAIRNMVCWQPSTHSNKVIHIHGDNDMIFPIKNIQNCIVLKGGSHIMLLNKGKEVTEKLIAAISE